MMNKKKILKFGTVAIALFAGVVFFTRMVVGGDDEIKLDENQNYVYAYVSEIKGNEMTYAVLDEAVVTEYLEKQEERMMSTEQITTLIPVGTMVHTQAETVTTFQRLATGDMIKMIVETTEDGEEVITEIWMM